ncbi:MAG: ribosome biogenesis GTPase Der [Acidobacteriia bacterium]|nr:ribosome biogenesis GTPase Der [Terriglobia bacterium]
MKKPTVAIIGRPNVGKSTLFNRICRQRRSMVGNESGMTRDRIDVSAQWNGHHFELIDTGGLIPGNQDLIQSLISEQAGTAIQNSQVLVLVVDGRKGLTSLDLTLAKFLIQKSIPVIVAANKCDTIKQWANTQEFFELGFETIIPISAAHGLNVGDLLDAVCKYIPLKGTPKSPVIKDIRVAIVGKPNVGKSTLLNTILGEGRAIVSPLPGTTRDSVDSVATREGQTYRFIDTAGIRKKRRTFLETEKLSVIMARKSIEQADVALIMVDATEGASSVDGTIANFAHTAGTSTIVVINKWDLINKNNTTMQSFQENIRERLRLLDYAPILFISAVTGQRINKLFPLIDQVFKARHTRIGTGKLNSFLQRIALNQVSVPYNRQVKVHYMTQIRNSPPTFVLMTNRKSSLHLSVQRYLINKMRKQFGFLGTPIILKQNLERKVG